jgi:leucyl aminopeptidase
VSRSSQVSPPDVALSEVPPSGVVGAEVVALPVLPGDDGVSLGPGAAELLDELDADLFGLLEHHKATGKAGEVTEFVVLDRTGLTNDHLRVVLLVGIGAGTNGELRKAGAAMARRAKGNSTVSTSLAALTDDIGLRALVEGIVLGSFGFHRKSVEPSVLPVARVVLAGLADPVQRKPALERAMAVAGAAWLSRSLAMVPANEKNPVWMAERSAEVAASANLQITVYDEKQLRDEGFGGISGVGQGSANPPRMIRLDYTPKKSSRRTKHIALIGKGITFDTGGYSIKSSDAMMNMKRDMTGAGVVLAVMGALAAVDCPVRVTGLLACAENSISGRAMRPGDVLRHYGGRTTEVSNTDAEGRLVMADALAYAALELKPDVLVDIATLTGAMKVSLGQRTAGYFANNDALAELVDAAGTAAGEPLWRMPLHADYEERLESKIADADNGPGGPGAITAALFLQHFTGGLPWAHLDIASAGDSPVDAFEYTSGPTGFGARTLLHWLELRDPLVGVHS